MNFHAIYELLLDNTALQPSLINELIIGLTWTLCRAGDDNVSGLAMSPHLQTRTLPWAGTLAGQSTAELAAWLSSWQMHEAVVAMAAINATLNHSDAAQQLQATATPIKTPQAANLAVFEHFLPYLQGQKVIVIGRYPGLDAYSQQLDLTVLERQPDGRDLPDQACESLIPQADWVFLTASSIPNKTFPRLAELSQQAVLVLMGPGTPWLAELSEFGVDFLAGVTIQDTAKLHQTVAEGGGVRIFEQCVQYAVADIGQANMMRLKETISTVANERLTLNTAMETWYARGERKRFPDYAQLDSVTDELSRLDTHYKRLWDARRFKT